MIQDTRFMILDAGYWNLDTRYRMLDIGYNKGSVDNKLFFSSFILHPLSFILYPSSFILHPFSFIFSESLSPPEIPYSYRIYPFPGCSAWQWRFFSGPEWKRRRDVIAIGYWNPLPADPHPEKTGNRHVHTYPDTTPIHSPAYHRGPRDWEACCRQDGMCYWHWTGSR